MAKPGNVDWEAVKTEYVTKKVSYRQLSEKYGVAIGNISKQAIREHWREQREQFVHKAFKKAEEIAADNEANRLAKLIEATNRSIDFAMNALNDEQQFNRYIISEGIGAGATQTEERIYAKVDTKALKDLTSVIKDLTGLMRDFYNIPTAAQAEARRIAAERLEIERRKADALVSDEDDDETGVVLIPEVDEDA